MTFRYTYGSDTADAFETHNPARPAEKIGSYGQDDEAAIAAAISKANAAQAEWAKVPGLERGQRLNDFLDAVVANVDRIAESVTLEQGKILAEAKGETLKGAAEGRFMVGEAARMGSQSISNGRANFSNQIFAPPTWDGLLYFTVEFPSNDPTAQDVSSTGLWECGNHEAI